MEIIEKEAINEAKAVSLIKKRNKELSYNEELAVKHKTVLALSESKANEMLNKLKEVVSNEAAVKIVDVFPANEEVIKFILNTYGDEKKFDEVMKIIKEVS